MEIEKNCKGNCLSLFDVKELEEEQLKFTFAFS